MGLKDRMIVNEVKVDLSGNLFYILGKEKAGKSSLYADFVKEFYGDANKGFYIPFENGFSYIKGLNRNDSVIEEWSDFVDLVDELVDEADELGIKVICLDTYDKFIKVATKEVLRLSKLKDGKKVDSLDGAYAGYGRGKIKLTEIVDEQLQRLRNAGLMIVVIGHTKYKKLKVKGTNDEYSLLGSNLTEDIHKIVANDADIIMMITVENKIEDGVIVGEERFIRFRSNGEYDCGGRIKNLPEKIKLDSKLFVKTLKEAISLDAEIKYEELDKLVDKQHKVIEKKAEEFKKEDKEIREIESTMKKEEMIEIISTAFKEDEDKKEIIIAKMKDISCKNFKALEDEDYESVLLVYKAII